MGWQEDYKLQREKERAIRENRVNKGWIITKEPDSATMRFRDKMQRIITEELTQRIEHDPEMMVQIGPYSHNFRNKPNGNLIALITLDATLEINWVHGPRLEEMGFEVSGVNQKFTLEGVINYINEEWLVKQKTKLSALRKRAKIMKDLEEAMTDLNAQQFSFHNISKLLKSIIIGNSTAKHWDNSDIYIITDKNGFKAIDKYKYHSYNRGLLRPPTARRGFNDWKFTSGSLEVGVANLQTILSVVVRRHKTQTRVQHFDPNIASRWRMTGESSWFSPKNLMKQLDKYAKSNPCITAILTNPEVGNASV